MTELPFDVLNLIVILLATSTNGAKNLARISKTCKKLKEHAEQTCILKIVSFQGLRDDYIKHLHPRDLIFQCARVGNQSAECILGKAFLTDYCAFRHMIPSNDQPTPDEIGSYVSGPIQHPRLVRSFIRLASSNEINYLIFKALHGYLLSFAGLEKCNAHGMFVAVRNMFLYELKMFCDADEFLGSLSLNNFAQVMPPHDVAHREEVIVIFDKLFRLTNV